MNRRSFLHGAFGGVVATGAMGSGIIVRATESDVSAFAE